ncbi:MAG: GatB/YqeY domain-containing protein [Desulfobacteraceae bacterium]|nr:GatB/YqeY domain-containing protein [Desulfobacteraceae bacterium]
MTIHEQIKKDLMLAMKEKDEEKKNTLRVLMGEFARSDKKSLFDDEVTGVIKKLIKSERETIGLSGEKGDNRYIEILETYLPRMATDADIRAWIAQHIDFASYKNKMQAMKDIMNHFGAKADGNQVKAILMSL